MSHKPNLFVIGAQKSGTTRLCHLLNQHPDVYISPVKEPEMFHLETPPAGRAEFYQGQFAGAGEAKVIGEASTVYSRESRFPGTAERIHRFNPDARIIYIVRHPLDRIESAWIQAREDERHASPDFNRAVRTSHDILDATLYWKQLNCYRQYFPDEQILLLFFEDFVRDEQKVVERCLEFLGLEPSKEMASDREGGRNSFAGKKHATPLFDALRCIPLYESLRKLVPSGLKGALRDKLMQPINTRPQWDEATLGWAIEQLRDDTKQLLRFANKKDDFWELSMDRASHR